MVEIEPLPDGNSLRKTDIMLRLLVAVVVCLPVLLAGCQSGNEYGEYDQAPESDTSNPSADDHDHTGVHGGTIIEFDAAHAHHGEVVFDPQSRDITVYFYGSKIGEAHAASDVVFELEEGDDEIHLEVTPRPLEGETEETASCFVVSGSGLPEGTTSLDELHGHFHVTLDGEEYSGHFGHAGHDHGGEDGHAHDDHEHEHDDHDHEEADHAAEETSAAE